MSGDTECVQLLLNFGHQVDCVDKCGWPPLLYANFKAHESCVLALMKPKPDQVFVLGTLLRKARNELDKKRTVKVHVHCTLCSDVIAGCVGKNWLPAFFFSWKKIFIYMLMYMYMYVSCSDGTKNMQEKFEDYWLGSQLSLRMNLFSFFFLTL